MKVVHCHNATLPYRNTLRNLTVLPDTWHCMAKTETESNNSLTFADPPLTWLTDQRMCFYMASASGNRTPLAPTMTCPPELRLQPVERFTI